MKKWMWAALVLLLLVPMFVLDREQAGDISTETKDRVTAVAAAQRRGCEDRNDLAATLKEIVDIATAGLPPGRSLRIDALRARADAIKPRDCAHLTTPTTTTSPKG